MGRAASAHLETRTARGRPDDRSQRDKRVVTLSQPQLDGYGLKAQEQDIRNCAKAHGLKLRAILRDEGVSGSTEAIGLVGQGSRTP